MFIPKSKNKEGHRFGFVRFKEVEDELGQERQLDNNIFFGRTKMFVNRPKFQRGRVATKNHNDNSIHGNANIQGVDRRSQGAFKTNVNGGRLWSYAEVVRVASLEVSILCNQKSVFPQAPKDVRRPVAFNTNMEQKE